MRILPRDVERQIQRDPDKVRASIRGEALPARMDDAGGPMCGCGLPSRYESGWCGTECSKRFHSQPDEKVGDPMSDKTLVAELSARLHEVGEAEVRVVAWDVLDGELCDALARECWRQMRWAYSEGWSDNSGDPHDDEDRFGEPSLAPKDWNP